MLKKVTRTTGLLGGLLTSCGTQIGNPNGSGAAGVTEESSGLGTLVNAAFLQTIDGINMGDYAYSRQESRVSTDRRCQSQSGSSIALVDRADTHHTVVDESEQWLASSELKIRRSYQDAWSQGGRQLSCDPSARAFRLKPEQLQHGPVLLQSKVDEELDRELVLTEKKTRQAQQQKLSLKKSGQRSLTLVNFTEQGQSTELEAELRNTMETTLTLTDAQGRTQPVRLQLQDRFPLNFLVTLDRSQQWLRYEIRSGRQDFLLPDSGETLRLELNNLRFSQDGGCVPQSGQLSVTVGRSSGGAVRYSINFQPKAPLVLRAENGSSSLPLAPFACVLKER